ncbi:MAG TPA: hypothetical protein VNO14_17860, partial [Blastocatellia bacterium]|nr:hypothetical protein [Blastocatellia bacterium]
MEKILIFGDVSAPPFINNLSAPVRAFQRVAEVKVIEPRFVEGFVPTGAARPAMVPEVSVRQALSEFDPTIVVCLGGGLFIP